jgi:hypothetical protein
MHTNIYIGRRGQGEDLLYIYMYKYIAVVKHYSRSKALETQGGGERTYYIYIYA